MLALFDSLNDIHRNLEHVILPGPQYLPDYQKSLEFLKCYNGSVGTFNSYRREVERLLQWCWHVKKGFLKDLKRDDIEQFIHFCQSPPNSWIGLKKVPRYILKEGIKAPNEAWRPFVVTVSKAQRKMGKEPSIEHFSLSQGAVGEIFAILSSFFNYLIAEEYLIANPVALIRQKSKFIRKKQQAAPVRRLSHKQWQAVLDAAECFAQENPEKHERTRFILSLLFGMYLRISEVAASERWTPSMNDFFKDGNGHWWFLTVGKGNKERQIAVSEEMLSSLMRWRSFLGYTPLPSPADSSPLIPKMKGHGPLSDTAPIRRLIQTCFDRATEILRRQGAHEDADGLTAATVHWLRHTGISEDVKSRPREHVRDDAGHSSSATTDRYIDIEKEARYQSAKNKKIIPNILEPDN